MIVEGSVKQPFLLQCQRQIRMSRIAFFLNIFLQTFVIIFQTIKLSKTPEAVLSLVVVILHHWRLFIHYFWTSSATLPRVLSGLPLWVFYNFDFQWSLLPSYLLHFYFDFSGFQLYCKCCSFQWAIFTHIRFLRYTLSPCSWLSTF